MSLDVITAVCYTVHTSDSQAVLLKTFPIEFACDHGIITVQPVEQELDRSPVYP